MATDFFTNVFQKIDCDLIQEAMMRGEILRLELQTSVQPLAIQYHKGRTGFVRGLDRKIQLCPDRITWTDKNSYLVKNSCWG